MKPSRPSPPPIGEKLLKRLVPPGVKGQSIIGDAREEYLEHLRSSSRLRAGVWYWKHVLSILAYFPRTRRQRTTQVTVGHRTTGSRLGNLFYDFKLAARLLRKKPGLALAAVLTLGLGIGANSILFSVVDGVLLKPLPYPDPDRLVSVYRIDPDVTGKKPKLSDLADLYAVPPLVFNDWKELSPVFESAGAYENEGFTLTGGERPERLQGATVTSGVVETLGVKPLLGRAILPEEDAVGAAGVAVLSYRLWQRRFGSDETVLGRQVPLNGTLRTVVGVMPPGFRFPGEHIELWTNFDDERKASPLRNAGFLQVIARLKPGIPLEQAQREMDAVAQRIGELHPEEKDLGIGLYPRKALVVSGSQNGLLLLMGAVGLVLLIACANMANLLLVRATERRREVGVRQALGAGWQRLMVQHFSEGLMLSLVGGAAGCSMAVVGLDPFTATFPGGLPRVHEITVDYRLLGFAVVLSALTALWTGLLPAFSAMRAPIVEALRDGGRGLAGGRRRSRTQTALVVSEVALAFTLLAGAAMFIRSFFSMSSVDTGFAADHRLMVSVVLPSRYRDSEEASARFFNEVRQRFASLPGVKAVGHAAQMPFGMGWSFPPVSIEGSQSVREDNIHNTAVSPEYFSTMDIPLLAGRGFTEADRNGTMPVALVNQTMARRFWPEDDPIGHRIKREDLQGANWVTIVGVVGDTRYQLNWEPFPAFYVPYAQRRVWYGSFILESASDPTPLIPAVRDALWEIDPEVPAQIGTLEDRIRQSDAMSDQRFQTSLLGCLAGLAVLLAVVGIYGVLSYAVSQRVHEIGIRMAFGAGSRHVVGSILRRGLVMAAIGLSIGLAITLVASRAMESLLFEVSPTDPATLLGVALLVVTVVVAASILPAYRATRVDPTVALRQE